MKVKKNNVSHPYYLCGECWREYCDSKRETELKHIPVGEPAYELSSSNPDSKWTGARFCEKHYIEFIKECADVAGFRLVRIEDEKPFVKYSDDMYMCVGEQYTHLLCEDMLTVDKKCPRCGSRVVPFNI